MRRTVLVFVGTHEILFAISRVRPSAVGAVWVAVEFLAFMLKGGTIVVGACRWSAKHRYQNECQRWPQISVHHSPLRLATSSREAMPVFVSAAKAATIARPHAAVSAFCISLSRVN